MILTLPTNKVDFNAAVSISEMQLNFWEFIFGLIALGFVSIEITTFLENVDAYISGIFFFSELVWVC